MGVSPKLTRLHDSSKDDCVAKVCIRLRQHMAVSSASDKNSYTLSEFVEVFELPKSVRVTKGQKDRNKKPNGIKEGQIFLFDRVSKVNCLSGVTSIGEHKVCIPIDCQQRVEILNPRSMHHGADQTVRESLVRSPAPEGKYIRVVSELKMLSDKQVLKVGEILKLLSVDEDGKLLMAIDNQGCIFHLPLSCSVAFHLLQSAGEEYLLADVLAKDLLPTYVRFVNPVSPEVRRTFIEEDHEQSLGAVYLERAMCEHRGIEVTFDDTLDSWTRISWLPIDIDITVAQLHVASDTELDTTDTERAVSDTEWDISGTDGDIHQPYEIMVGPNMEPPLPHRNDDECGIVSSSERELNSKSISGGKTEASPRGQVIDPTYEVMFDAKWKQPLPRPNDGECILTGRETELGSISGKAETSPTGNARPGTKHFLKPFVSLPNLRQRNKEIHKKTGNDRGTMPGAPRRKSTDPLPVEPSIYEEMKCCPPKYGRLSDIPSDLTILTKEDVSSLLEILNLGEYAARFYHAEVDGCRLVDLNVDTLVSSFGFGKFHALKLSKFVTGWRPCFLDGH